MLKLKIKYCKSKKCRILLLAFFLLAVAYWLCLPGKLFDDPTSVILYSREGRLMGARIADDGQWRFPEMEKVPEKFKQSLLTFEDNYFYKHPGINPVAFGRACVQNVKAGKIVSGGSTITMQLMRIARKGQSRTIFQKLIEMVWATRAELRFTKEEILAMYASHAPFGGNVVGVEVAAWRFFGRNANQLSWAEAATLAVLPNAPSLIYPGKNSQLLLQKRNRLLDRLQQKGIIDATTCRLSKLERVPEKIHRLPQVANHLLDRVYKEQKGKRVVSSIDYTLQQQVAGVVQKHQAYIEANQIHNMAVLVLDVETGKSLAYVGNTKSKGKENHGNQVDIIRAERSTGSVLKPFLYAAMLNEGSLLPNTLVPDIPTQVAGYSPKNFNLNYDGAVPASIALARSLNVPAVRMLRDYGVERFHFLLKKMGMKSLNRPAGHYGLSLILGGAEGRLWELCGMYASMGRVLNHYNNSNGEYFSSDIHAPSYLLNDSVKRSKPQEQGILGAASICQTFDALLEVTRPDGEDGWRSFSSSGKIAWKTGTSFGFRDGWAIGCTPTHVIGVWVGNADGEGRPGLTGVSVAAPVMFDVFRLLPTTHWFEEPADDMVQVLVCKESGYLAGRWCNHKDTVWVAEAGQESEVCPYHQLVHLDKTRRYRVNAQCEKISNMVHESWFVLPPAMEWYYKKQNPLYRSLPPFRDDCVAVQQHQPMELIYPKNNDRIFLPVDLDGIRNKLVVELAHENAEAEIFWHMDGRFIGSTIQLHQMELAPDEGEHLLTFMDKQGNMLYKKITIVEKQERIVK
ncbi:penicillin-binding protein 1C [Prolixibacteraceae bacterium JC049]|nr:penicillin-binding protein 1C [Prolixibacteraceae bacterium JC049]